jgi:hypothetical protein
MRALLASHNRDAQSFVSNGCPPTAQTLLFNAGYGISRWQLSIQITPRASVAEGALGPLMAQSRYGERRLGCPLVTQCGHQEPLARCPLSGVKRTFGAGRALEFRY